MSGPCLTVQWALGLRNRDVPLARSVDRIVTDQPRPVARRMHDYARSGPFGSGFRKRDASLPLIFAAAVAVAGFTHLIALKKHHLRAAFTGVDLGGQWRGVAEFQRDVAFPLG